MNLETLTTPDRYVYVGPVRFRRFFFPANLQREPSLRRERRRWRPVEQDREHARMEPVQGPRPDEAADADRERGTGRKRRSLWSHMTMYDEGMMDEGAASLRDRDMIAGKRGGPSVRARSFLFPSHGPGSSSRLSPFLCHAHYTSAHERAPTHPCHRSERSCCHILRTRPYGHERSCSLTRSCVFTPHNAGKRLWLAC